MEDLAGGDGVSRGGVREVLAGWRGCEVDGGWRGGERRLIKLHVRATRNDLNSR